MNERYCAAIEEIGGNQFYVSLDELTPDYGSIHEKFVEALKKHANLDTMTKILKKNTDFLSPGPGYVLLSDQRYANLKADLAALASHQRLRLDGQKVNDWRGVEYWKKTNGTWIKTKIETIGIDLPVGYVLPDDLTPVQQKEISDQQEANRIASLTPDQKSKELEGALKNALREIALQKAGADIEDKPFDAKAVYQQKKAALGAKYGLAV